jgi:hypothetical protein
MNQTRLNNDQADKRAEYRLTKEERETLYRIDEVDNTWYADSTIQKDIHKLERQGWIEIGVQYYNDGTVMAKQFKAPRNCLSPRSYNPDKPKRKMSEEHKQKVMKALQASREAKKLK